MCGPFFRKSVSGTNHIWICYWAAIGNRYTTKIKLQSQEVFQLFIWAAIVGHW